MNNRWIVSALLQSYPAKWREQYGPELADLLQREPVTPAIVGNVIRSGLLQRVRQPAPWMKVALLFTLWFIAGLLGNTIHTMPEGVYTCFWAAYLPLEVITGFWLKKSGARFPGLGTGCAVLLSSLPMSVIEVLRARNLLNPTIIDTRGHVWRSGSGFTEFAYRGEFVRPAHQFMKVYWIVVLAGCFLSFIAGFTGGKLAVITDRLRPMKASR